MSDIVNPILQWLNAHPNFAGIATFIISASESVAIIGTIIPGSIMMTAIGALAGAGVIPLWSTIFWAILGAIMGDGISYWLGYYYKDRLHYVWPFRKYPHVLETGQRFFLKHGGKSVFFGRFVGPVRALVPLVAGMMGMKPWRFTFANVLSAIGWAPAYMAPGIALGAASLELPPDIAVHAILMLLLIILFVILCLWILRTIFLLIDERINHSLAVIWQRLDKSRVFHPVTSLLKHYDPQETHGQLVLAFYFLITTFAFAYLALYIHWYDSSTIFLNNAFFHLFRSLRTPTFDTIFFYVSLLGEQKIMFPVAAILFFWLAWQKRWRTAWHLAALVLLTAVSVQLFKKIIYSPRPWGIVHSPKGFSFPSGHAVIAITYYFGLITLLIRQSDRVFRRFWLSIGITVVTLIAISRLYLGAHWFTDVIGGLLLGISILMLVVLSYNRKEEKPIDPLKLYSIFLVSLALSYLLNYYFWAEKLKMNYVQLEWPAQSISLPTWWEHKNIPLYRLNRFGLATQILNLQWIGDIEDIKQVLIKNGWRLPPKTDWITVLHRISDVQSSEHLPLVSPLYFDKKPVLVLIKQANGNKKLIVLRLWDSRILINNKQTLWVGTVEIVPRTYSWLFRHKRSNEINLKSSFVFSGKPEKYIVKEIQIGNKHRKGQEENLLLIKPKGM